jgi:uncharacterized protein YceK
MALSCAVCLLVSGCSDPLMNSSIAHPGTQSGTQSDNQSDQQSGKPEIQTGVALPETNTVPAVADAVDATLSAAEPSDPIDPFRPRVFPVEGADGALRVTFDDFDLMKLLKMDPVTPDCIDKMPDWLKDLSGKTVRVRGFMKPCGVIEGIPEFLFVRSTDLCCFGPKGKVYHLVAVKLKPGLTTDYIELKPFDVEGRFRIEMVELDGLIFLLYHIDDATIIRN